MMRSLYSGVSGLQNHQTRMDVIGNNVSNVNTIGFKKGRVIFQDMISQGMRGAARPSEELGGVNPMQVGLGMTVATIDTIHTQGSLQSTGNTTDLAIQGNGFFILSQGDKEFYSRAGAFGLDEGGMLVNPANGMRVQGWEAETVDGETFINSASDTKSLFIPIGSKDPASATSEVELACNLDKRTPEVLEGAGPGDVRQGSWTIDKDIYDNFGNVHKMTVNFTKVNGTANQWNVNVAVDEDAELPSNTTLDIGAENNTDNNFIMEFDNLGALTAAFDGQGDRVEAGALLIPVSFDVQDTTPDGDGALLRQTLNLNLGEVGSYTNTVTQFAETSSTKAFRQNGYSMGYLETFQIDSRGVITGVYSNGTNRSLGQVALASFVNPGGLEKNGESTFMETINSGEANVGPSGIAGKGKFVSGALEMSNVDLAEQFTDMIITQRGFQANSKTITTSDTMLQELLQLKR
ncbi:MULTISPECIES: flagellar hook protein FlgE [unclassified Oceanispirochaeta]|uniref:flagellar hook protein FlgE n=1 Tax=unclassified Oceanispirochaeta TaxID=2635722 RepID=UPI000E09A30D|nr:MULTISPECIES: flagellar hook protein FlgE [unclassified Oceanispirochaeta]MBF9016158.1 flagellar hook protein FlgE [Oceanispirochaeta sp. M2]NPD72620.1 flagellar hook protein FlgE [Oceanispirochaeta sp. M1]RDG31771.1 flagellar hook protein FlgE [Oceanispirochaeta sp. M1]